MHDVMPPTMQGVLHQVPGAVYYEERDLAERKRHGGCHITSAVAAPPGGYTGTSTERSSWNHSQAETEGRLVKGRLHFSQAKLLS